MHRRRRVEGKSRQWEGSFADPCRGLIVWPPSSNNNNASDAALIVETTLYADSSNGEYDDKEWTLIVEDFSAKGKRKTLAAVSLNMRLFVQNSPGTSSEVKLKMRPLWTGVTHCSIQVLITSTLLGEADTNETDLRSETSSLPGGRGASLDREVIDALDAHHPSNLHPQQQIDGETQRGISNVSNDIQKWKAKSMDDAREDLRDTSKPSLQNDTTTKRCEPKRNIDTVPFEDTNKSATQNANSLRNGEATKPYAAERIVVPQPTVKKSTVNDDHNNKQDVHFSSSVIVTVTQRRDSTVKSPTSTTTEKVLSSDAKKTETVTNKSNNIPTDDKRTKNETIIAERTKQEAIADVSKKEETPKIVVSKKGERKLPDVIEGEDLLAWCQRITQGYQSVKIADFTKSFRSGLALCAIIHRYRPETIGNYQALDFSDSLSGRRENCRKALLAAAQLGVNRKLDAGVIVTLPERHEVQSFLSELRNVLEGVAPSSAQQRINNNESDHRISALFNLSESETSVMRELENLRKQREQEEAIDLTNIPEEDRTKYEAVAPGSLKSASLNRAKQPGARKLVNPFDSDSDDDDDIQQFTSSSSNRYNMSSNNNNNNSATKYFNGTASLPRSVYRSTAAANMKTANDRMTESSLMSSSTSNDENINGGGGDNIKPNGQMLSPVVQARHEQLLKKRRQLIDDSKLTDKSLNISDEERAKRLREEARRLMETAATEGTTIFLSGSAPATTHQSPAVPSTSSNLQRKASVKLAESLGSNKELRCLEVTTPPVNIYNFKKLQPSPILQRKKYDAPLIQAFERPTQRLTTSQSDIRNDIWPSAFDRVKRYGSMRGQELADTVARMAGISVTPTVAQSTNTAEATPTRKLVSHWEKDLEKMQEEQSNIANRLAEVSEQDEKICALLKRTKESSEEEERLLREHMRLLNEKDALVRRSEYFNVLEQMKEVQDDISALQKKLSHASFIEQEDKTEEDKQTIDRMMDELVELVNRKDQLAQKLIQHEAEDEEFDERDRLTLQATANFSRGYEQPISASKRLITWIRSEISS